MSFRWTTVAAAALALTASAAGSTTTAAAQAGPSVPPSPPSMAFVGDSIGFQAEEQVVDEVSRTRPVSHVFVANGATVDYSRPQVARIVRRPDGPSILVVELGHADANLLHSRRQMQRDIRAFLDAVTPHVDCLRWLDIRPSGTLYPNVNATAPIFNRTLSQVAASYPNAEVMHYSTWAANALPGYWHPDQLHVSNTGKREIGRIVRQAADGCDPATASGPFWDVQDRYWAARSVAWVADQGLATGFANGTYRALIGSRQPPLTRGQLATMLWRRAGSPTELPLAPWTDVPRSLDDAVAWVADEGLLAGTSPSTYHPGRSVTRGEFFRAWWVLAGSPVDCPFPALSDVPGHLVPAVACAIDQGLVAPPGNGRFRPAAPIDRGRVAHALAPPEERGPVTPPSPAPVSDDPERIELEVLGEPTLVAPD